MSGFDMDNLCLICHENLSTENIGTENIGNTYELPECKHSYHTDCIIEWFSNGSNKCPYCSNKGINYLYISEDDQHYLIEQLQRERPVIYFHSSWRRGGSNRSGTLCKYGMDRLKIIKKYVHQHGPEFLVNEFKQLEKEMKLSNIAEKNVSEYKKKMTNDKSILYYEGTKEINKLRTKRYASYKRICTIKNHILSYPIHPLIIPTTTI